MRLAIEELLVGMVIPKGENKKEWLTAAVPPLVRALYDQRALPATIPSGATLLRAHSDLQTSKGRQRLEREIETMREAMRNCPTELLPAVPPLNATLTNEFRLRSKETICKWIERVNQRVPSLYLMKQNRTVRAAKGTLLAEKQGQKVLAPAFKQSKGGKSTTRTSEFASRVVLFKADNKLTNDATTKTVRYLLLLLHAAVVANERERAVCNAHAQARGAADLLLLAPAAAQASAAVPASTTVRKYTKVDDAHNQLELKQMASEAECLIGASDSGAKGDKEHSVEVLQFYYEPDDVVLRVVLAVIVAPDTKGVSLAASTQRAWAEAGIDLKKQTAHVSDTCASMQGRHKGAIQLTRQKTGNAAVSTVPCLPHCFDLALRAGLKHASGESNAW
jgi:hypothetical protein